MTVRLILLVMAFVASSVSAVSAQEQPHTQQQSHPPLQQQSHPQLPQQRPQPHPQLQKKKVVPLSYPFDAGTKGQAEVDDAEPVDMAPDQKQRLDEILALFGNGYNTFSGKQTPVNCVNGIVHGQQPASRKVEYTLRHITSAQDMSSELKAEASISGDLGAWSAKASASYNRSKQSDKQSEFVLVKARVTLSPNITLRQGKASEQVAGNTREAQLQFFQDCGDAYVEKVTMGGEFLALLKYEVQNEADRKAFDLTFSAHGFGASADASLSSEVKEALKSMRLELDSQTVGGVGGPTDNSAAAVMQFGIDFPKSVTLDNSQMVDIIASSYRSVHLSVDNLSNFNKQHDAMAAALSSEQTYVQSASQAQDEMLKYGVGSNYQNAINSANISINNTTNALSACEANPYRCGDYPALQSFRQPIGIDFPKYQEVNANSQSTVHITYSNGPLHLIVSGHVCYNNDGFCADDGKKLDNNNAVTYRVNGGQWLYYEKPMTLPAPPAGQATKVDVRIFDAGDYGDNSGSYKVVYY